MSPTSASAPIVLVGAGPVGLAAAEAAVADGIASGVKAVVDPVESARQKAGQVLGARMLLPSLDELGLANGASAVVAFSSRSGPTAAAISMLLARGYSVVTTCEDLAYPSTREAKQLRLQAQDTGRAVVVTGANPGFVMDRLPLVLSGGVRGLSSIRVTRRLNTQKRRGPLVTKTGYGLSPEDFRVGIRAGSVGHAGLEASVKIIAHGLGWRSRNVTSSIEPVMGDEGLVGGLHQMASLSDAGRDIVLDLTMAWGVADASDVITIEGDPCLRVVIDGGYHGDTGTTARVLAAITALPNLAAGLYGPGDASPLTA